MLTPTTGAQLAPSTQHPSNQETAFQPSKLVCLSCNYNNYPRFQSNPSQLRIPFQVEKNLKLIDIQDHNLKPRRSTPVFAGEHFINTIAGGGSGASVALIRNTHNQLIVRKLQQGPTQKEAAQAQNLESIGQAMLIGKEPMTSLAAKVRAVVHDKANILTNFIQATRPEVTKRFVILEEKQGEKNTYVACGYDQTAFENPHPAEATSSPRLAQTAPEFAKVIQNNNTPLSDTRLNTLVKAQPKPLISRKINMNYFKGIMITMEIWIYSCGPS